MNNTLSISDVLKLMLNSYEITESNLAQYLNLPRQTINRICIGKTYDPKSSTLIKIANFFNITVDQLLGNVPITFQNNNKPMPLVSIPIITSEQLIQNSTLNFDDFSPDIKYTYMDTTESDKNTLFAIKLDNNAMYPKFDENSILIFSKTLHVGNKAYVLVHINKTQQFYFRQLFIDGSYKTLVATNKNFPTIIMENNDEIKGVLIKAIKDFL